MVSLSRIGNGLLGVSSANLEWRHKTGIQMMQIMLYIIGGFLIFVSVYVYMYTTCFSATACDVLYIYTSGEIFTHHFVPQP